MRNFLFTNRWAALGFVGATVLGAVVLVGDEDSGGVLDVAGGTIETRHESMQADLAELSRPVDSPPIVIPRGPVEFADEQDLIDDTTGMDPSPIDTEADAGPPPMGPEPFAGPEESGMLPVDGGEIIGE